LTQADELLDHTVLRAPYSGVVVERHVEVGESTSPGQPIMTGYALGQLRVTANVPQSVIGGLRDHRLARVIMLEDGHSIEVSKITIYPFANPQRLYPGMLVKVAITTGSAQRLVMPQQALVSRAEVNAVYVLDDDGKISFRQIRPGSRYGDQVEILAGLDAGETIALDPVRAGIQHKRQLETAE
jgi:multidrug efflux pump subunit AcrA (membrane-fusion protein)